MQKCECRSAKSLTWWDQPQINKGKVLTTLCNSLQKSTTPNQSVNKDANNLQLGIFEASTRLGLGKICPNLQKAIPGHIYPYKNWILTLSSHLRSFLLFICILVLVNFTFLNAHAQISKSGQISQKMLAVTLTLTFSTFVFDSRR